MEITKVYLLGLTLAFAIGPMALLIVQRSITKGLSSAMATALAIALADFTYALIAFSIGASLLNVVERNGMYIHLFSGVVLLGLAIHMLSSALKTHTYKHVISSGKTTGGDFMSGYVLTLHNPLTIAVFLGFLGHINDVSSIGSIVMYSFALFLGSYSGQITIGCIGFCLRGFLQHPKAILIFNILSATGIATFGLLSFANAFKG